MGSKRPFSAVESAGGEGRFTHQKKRKSNNAYEIKENSINAAKKRARDIERRLKKGDDLPADVQQKLERELAALQRRVEEVQGKKLRQKMIKKYHMVRFFEKRKAQRLQKQLRKKLDTATDPEEIAEIRKGIHICDVDIAYTVYFPYLEPYISLYPSSNAKSESVQDERSSAASNLHSERPPLWRDIEEAIEKGEASLERLRDRRPGELPSKNHTARSKPHVAKQDKSTKTLHRDAGARSRNDWKKRDSERRRRRPEEDEAYNDDAGSDGDGGGFFEEA